MWCDRSEGTGCVPVQNLLLLADTRIWVCAHAEYITFGKTKDLGRVPVQKNCKHWACAPCGMYYLWQS